LDTRLFMSLNFRQVIALQTLLDRQNFSCNCADGKIGSRTHAALRAFQQARGLTITGEPNATTLAKLGDLGSALTSYTVSADDHAQLTQNPTTWLGRSQATRLGYQTILEAMAERGHATQQAIRDLNPQVAVWPDPPAGTTLTIPDVGQAATLPNAARIRIAIGNKLVRVFDGAGDQVAQFPCSIARDPAKREPCEISVAVVAPNPNYTFDPALFSEEPESKTIKTKLIIPPGPRNPVGSAWVGLSKTGYGMHGTPKPEDIGKTESHGCFRLANWNAQKLLRMVDVGTPVIVEE
ncbi:MAG: L,D-transpeptidase, partial [Kiritimatiellaeota bacterium]|nr:L,D-transpeptidase [Kiritimatiellota bacterium]